MKKPTLEELKVESFITSGDKVKGGTIFLTHGCQPSFPEACITQTEWGSCDCQ